MEADCHPHEVANASYGESYDLIPSQSYQCEFTLFIDPFYVDTIQVDITWNMRIVAVNWLLQVANNYNISNEAWLASVNYMDRFLSHNIVLSTELQLVSVCCLMISCKYWDSKFPSIDDYIYISADTYSKTEMNEMESNILNSMKFELKFDLSLELIKSIYSHEADNTCITTSASEIQSLGRFMIELFTLFDSSLHYSQKTIAASALFLSLYTYEESCAYVVENINLANFDDAHIKYCISDLYDAYLAIWTTPKSHRDALHMCALIEMYQQSDHAYVLGIVPKIWHNQFDIIDSNSQTCIS
jgi:cyclin A